MRVLRTPRLVLEPQVEAHAEAMFAVLSDPRIYEYENAPPRSLAWLRERFRKLESRRSADGLEQWLNWVVRQGSGELIGYVQASVHGDARASIAYELASRFWGQGLAREAVRAMIDELVRHYGVREVGAVFKAANVRSQRLLERLGFEFAPPPAGIEADEGFMRRAITP